MREIKVILFVALALALIIVGMFLLILPQKVSDTALMVIGSFWIIEGIYGVYMIRKYLL